jgi:hypothetical protein
MAGPDTKIHDYADELMSTPRAHLALELRQDDDGLKLLYQDNLIVECFLTEKGMAAANYMTKALGVRIPPLGETVKARVSTGVLFRAVSIASLDFDVEESFILLDRLMEEAALQRTGSSELT